MAEITIYEPGKFCWVDLATSDAADAKRFYGGLFGWEFRDLPAGPEMVYSMALVGGKDVAALYLMGEEEKGMPPRWQTYVSVRSADAVAAKAAELGGTVLAAPFDVFDAGRMAILRDPSGAVFSVWEPRSHIGARLTEELGTFCWNELLTRDEVKAKPFYMGLLGWGARLMEFESFTYTVFTLGDVGEAGMMPMPAEACDAPSHWLVYFLVADCDRSAAKAVELGGLVLKGPADIPSVGRFAVIRDPQGAVFAIFKPAMGG